MKKQNDVMITVLLAILQRLMFGTAIASLLKGEKNEASNARIDGLLKWKFKKRWAHYCLLKRHTCSGISAQRSYRAREETS